MTVVLVCGGRDYSDRQTVYKTLDRLHATHPFTRLVTGGANGADALAVDWAAARQVPRVTYPANWEKLGRSAGPQRNQFMLDVEQPAVVVAFPGGAGTADMLRRAERASCVEMIVK